MADEGYGELVYGEEPYGEEGEGAAAVAAVQIRRPRIRFLHNNLALAEGAVWTASTQASGFPVNNLKNRRRRQIWRATTAVSGQWVKVHLGSGSHFVKTVGVTGFNLIPGAIIHVEASTNDITYTSIIDLVCEAVYPQGVSSGSVGFGEGGFGEGGFGGGGSLNRFIGRALIGFFSSRSEPYWRFTFSDVNQSEPYEAGLIYVGSYFEPTEQIGLNWSLAPIDPTEIEETPIGQTADTEFPVGPYLGLSFGFPYISQSDVFDSWLPAIRTYRILQRDIFLSLFPDVTNELRTLTNLFGRIVNRPQVTNLANRAYSISRIEFEESF